MFHNSYTSYKKSNRTKLRDLNLKNFYDGLWVISKVKTILQNGDKLVYTMKQMC